MDLEGSQDRKLPRGFLAAGVHSGVKDDPQREDLALICCPRGAVTAGVYTQNVVFAAPVAVDRERTPSDDIRVLVINSGNANACTGDQGLRNAREMTRLAAAACGAASEQALVMSTGIIGQQLAMDRIAAGITAAADSLGSDSTSLLAAARGMTTTDRSPKVSGRILAMADGSVQVTGLAKGAGMIGPQMATMLAVILTDAPITVRDAHRILAASVESSFNCLSVEGHMSTNDTVLLLASAEASVPPLPVTELERLQAAVTGICIELAREIADDGEGASHLITLDVRGLRSRGEARQVAQTIANSPLVKTAITGADPNWGRILSAAGYADVGFDPAAVELSINGFSVYRDGAPTDVDEAVVSKSMAGARETVIELQFSEGSESIRFWTSDLTVDYVRFNAEYHT